MPTCGPWGYVLVWVEKVSIHNYINVLILFIYLLFPPEKLILSYWVAKLFRWHFELFQTNTLLLDGLFSGWGFKEEFSLIQYV